MYIAPMGRELLGIRVRGIRHDRGLTIGQLARLAHLNVNTVSRIERGHTSPKIEVLEKIAAALGVTTARLLGSEDNGE